MIELRTHPGLRRLLVTALLVGSAGLAISGLGAAGDRAHFFRAYLVSFVFWVSIALGSMALVMVHHLVAGRWGFAVQRLLEAASRTLPLMLVLFVPIVIGMPDLYRWTDADLVASDHVLHHKAAYLNTPFFLARAGFYFLVWVLLTVALCGWSQKLDATGKGKFVERLRSVSGPGLVLYVLTVSFAGFDWLMSTDPHWFSTIYGALMLVGQGLGAFAFVIVTLTLLQQQRIAGVQARPERFHELGNLMLAFVMLWAYISFSQFLIIWSGNLSEEIPWYVRRAGGGWQWIAILLIVGHFALPFLVLLSRRIKRRAGLLAWVAFVVLVMRGVDLYWQVAPNLLPSWEQQQDDIAVQLGWLDVTTLVGIGGLWVAYFLWQLASRPLTPQNDPRMQGAARHG